MKPKTVTIGETEVEITPIDGELVNGELMVSSISAEIKGENFLSLDKEVVWNENEIRDSVRAVWMEEKEWPDTCNENWNSPRILNPGTHIWETLEAVIKNYPVTNKELDEIVSYDYSASGQTADLKDMNLSSCIGYNDGKQIIVPTHLGLKEIHEFNGINNEKGLDLLFTDNHNDKEEEEDKEDEEHKTITQFGQKEE